MTLRHFPPYANVQDGQQHIRLIIANTSSMKATHTGIQTPVMIFEAMGLAQLLRVDKQSWSGDSTKA